MKIRNGFVSNSSTSSFVIMTTKENSDLAIKKLQPYFQKWLKKNLSTTTFLDTKVVYVGDITDTGGDSILLPDNFEETYHEEDNYEDTEEDITKNGDDINPFDIVEAWEKEIGKNKSQVFKVDLDL